MTQVLVHFDSLFYLLCTNWGMHSISNCAFWLVPDTTDASGSSQQGAFQQRPVSAAWTGSASGVAASSHALLLSVAEWSTPPYTSYTQSHRQTHTHFQLAHAEYQSDHQGAANSSSLEFLTGDVRSMDSPNKQYYLPLFLLLFCNCTLTLRPGESNTSTTRLSTLDPQTTSFPGPFRLAVPPQVPSR